MIEKDNQSVQRRIYVLGELQVERRLQNGTWETVTSSSPEWGPRSTYSTHTKSLLGYLLYCYHRQASRSAIIEALWVNNPASIDEYINRATYRLRNLLRDEQSFRLTANRMRYELAGRSIPHLG